MKNRIVNIVCGILIIASLIIIARSLLSMSKKPNRKPQQDEMISKSSDPLTEIDFQETLLDVGNLSRDTTIYQIYTFRNTGTLPLIVYNVNPDCNCTSYDLSKTTAMPNDSIKLTLTVATKNKKIGMFMLNTVVTVNTKKHMYRLRLVGNVVK